MVARTFSRRFGRSAAALAVLAVTVVLGSAPRAAAATITVTNRVQLHGAMKLNPRFWLGNIDDPVPPADYRPNDQHRDSKWYFRNPGHNFTFYVIGIADKTFQRSGRFPDKVFKPGRGWNFTVCKYKFLRLPFVSYIHGPFKFYLGWRERGDFGIELKL